MFTAHGYAAKSAKAPLVPFSFERRTLKAQDVLIAIEYCGVCHSDVHQARDEWGGGIFPMVPDHEIVGRVRETGKDVHKFKVGDLVGVGCLVDSCRRCPSCLENLEQYCENHKSTTYNGYEQDKITPTRGGYSDRIVVDEAFVLKIPQNLPIHTLAPLLCAGITTYSPLRHWGIKKGQKVGIIGLGGLGHMGVQFAHAFGAHTVVLTTSPQKKESAFKLGADEVILSKDPEDMRKHAATFDFLLSTLSVNVDLNPYLSLIKRDGTFVVVGLPEKPIEINPGTLILKRRRFAGSLIGGLNETQEMLDFCEKHNITCQVEVIPIQKINEAYERLVKNDVQYRFVIDMKSLSE